VAPSTDVKAHAELAPLGVLTVTAYRPIARQTDDSPTWTSIGDRTTVYGVAVSQDLLCKVNKHCRRNVALCDRSKIHYGDVLLIEGVGPRIVNDCMAPRHRNHLDVLVLTYADEKRFGTRHVKAFRLENH
jgi:3D (Asp-Asp-Asp) domain-containing protein